ncbi:MAG TPA: glycosyltransferase family 4 protein, partial [Thermoanaerobaculia bacterium]|nr:glycosyltransferase family 4 protein [Thermoanaerobaculia bacterium]
MTAPRHRTRLGLVSTHPIQYQVPWFAALAAHPRLDVDVGFGCLPDAQAQGVGFGTAFAWDLPLLDGYRSTELARHQAPPRLSTFFGIRLRRVADWLRAQRFDALVVTGWNSYALVQTALAARRLRLPLLVRGDSNDLRRRGLPARLFHRTFLRLFDAFLVVGKSNRRFYRRSGVPEAMLFDCPHFVDNERLAHQHGEALPRRAELRARWGVPGDAVCALFAGKLVAVKNVPELFAAVRIAVEQAPRLHLLVAGEGPLGDELRATAAREKLPVTFAGFLNQSEIPAAYVATDFLVLPSRSETWGLVVNEAMACGLPAVVSDGVGCAEDLVEPGATGFVYRT